MTEKQLLDLFRENLRQLREERGLSQSALARLLGTTPGYICDMERGRRGVNLATLAKLASALDVTPPTLISTVRIGYKPVPAL